ncbi:hypothetical protein NPIL_558441 [Nephila pilipes]|uniref:Uncharacterized protein n=1 Tax=Nephila pilipes TaxID=299642 RepID=A0A8X6PA50_NEPPI|nr:hypothetical protein NPIL_558441 [Nephila pilipes]
MNFIEAKATYVSSLSPPYMVHACTIMGQKWPKESMYGTLRKQTKPGSSYRNSDIRGFKSNSDTWWENHTLNCYMAPRVENPNQKRIHGTLSPAVIGAITRRWDLHIIPVKLAEESYREFANYGRLSQERRLPGSAGIIRSRGASSKAIDMPPTLTTGKYADYCLSETQLSSTPPVGKSPKSTTGEWENDVLKDGIFVSSISRSFAKEVCE